MSFEEENYFTSARIYTDGSIPSYIGAHIHTYVQYVPTYTHIYTYVRTYISIGIHSTGSGGGLVVRGGNPHTVCVITYGG